MTGRSSARAWSSTPSAKERDFDDWLDLAGLDLTPRQTEVARLAVAGLHNSEIAELLCISRRTVEKHLEEIYRRTGYRGRYALWAAVLNIQKRVRQRKIRSFRR